MTKDGRIVVVCRCCRNRCGNTFLPTTPASATSMHTRTPSSQVVAVEADATNDSPEVRCLCFDLESMSMKDAPRRSARLSMKGKAFN